MSPDGVALGLVEGVHAGTTVYAISLQTKTDGAG
jgi:hypothetical protein